MERGICNAREKEPGFGPEFAARASGFTAVEVVMAVAVLAVMSGIVAGAFRSFDREQALEKSAASLEALLARARSLTLGSRDARSYGVHFEERRGVLFQGPSYNAADPKNRIKELPVSVRVSSINLAGGGSEVLFNRLTGATAQSGTVAVSLAADPSRTRTVTIFPTGIAEAD